MDGQQVNLATIEQLLSTYTSSAKVKLSLQRPAKAFPATNEDSPDDTQVGPSIGSQGPEIGTSVPTLVRVLTGRGPSAGEVMALLKRLPYLVLYLTRAGITGENFNFVF